MTQTQTQLTRANLRQPLDFCPRFARLRYAPSQLQRPRIARSRQ